MAGPSLELSKVTARYQTTVPRPVRERLDLRGGDHICYRLEDDGRVYIEAARHQGDDPAVGKFLDLIDADIKDHPERLQALDSRLLDRARALVGEMEVDLDAPLSPEDE